MTTVVTGKLEAGDDGSDDRLRAGEGVFGGGTKGPRPSASGALIDFGERGLVRDAEDALALQLVLDNFKVVVLTDTANTGRLHVPNIVSGDRKYGVGKCTAIGRAESGRKVFALFGKLRKPHERLVEEGRRGSA